MPIKGLTDRESLTPRFPRLGKLRKGGPKRKNKAGKDIFGEDLAYWRFTSEDQEIVAAFVDVYGDQPRAVNVYLPYQRLEQNFETWIELWNSSGSLVWRSDGETQSIWLDGASYRREPRPHQDHRDQQEVGRLTFVVPELIQAGFIGTVTMETHSNHDLRAISSALLAIENSQEARGMIPDLRRIPFSLRKVYEEITTPGWGENEGKRVRVKKWLVKLVPHPDIAQAMLTAPTNGTPQLTSGRVDFETGEIIEHDGEPDFDDVPESSGPTLDEIGAAMLAVGPSGKALGQVDRLIWGKVMNTKDPLYSQEIKAAARLLFENQDLVQQWREERGAALDDIKAQDSLLDDDIPPEAY